MRSMLLLAVLVFATAALANEEAFVPLESVRQVGMYPEPYGRTVVTVEVKGDQPQLRVMHRLDFVSRTHRVHVPPDLLANFPLPQIEAMRLSWSEDTGGDGTVYASISVPFGEYNAKAKSYSHVDFVIVDGELESYTMARPNANGERESSFVQVKKTRK